MSHTYVSDLVHCVFSTKHRRKIIPPETQGPLWSFLGGIARNNGFTALMVGGTADHAHVLLSLPATIPLAKAMQLLKGASSKWMNENHGGGFAWQEGYGAFTVGVSQKARDDRVYPESGGTSPQAEFRGRVFGVFAEAPDRLRPEICVGVRVQASRRDAGRRIAPGNAESVPPLKRWAIVGGPSGTGCLVGSVSLASGLTVP
jgi:putative transposase